MLLTSPLVFPTCLSFSSLCRLLASLSLPLSLFNVRSEAKHEAGTGNDDSDDDGRISPVVQEDEDDRDDHITVQPYVEQHLADNAAHMARAAAVRTTTITTTTTTTADVTVAVVAVIRVRNVIASFTPPVTVADNIHRRVIPVSEPVCRV